MTFKNIHDRINTIAKECTDSMHSEMRCTQLIVDLVEDITGQKLEPEFDESLVKHGSVWQDSDCTVVFIQGAKRDGEEHLFHGVALKCNCGQKSHYIYEPKGTVEYWKTYIKSQKDCKYLGQFDFSWPQKRNL